MRIYELVYGLEEIRRLADAAEAALGAVEALRDRAEVWGDRLETGGLALLVAVQKCQALDRAARELGMHGRCHGRSLWPKPELTDRGDQDIFKDISTLLAELAACGIMGGRLPNPGRLPLPPEETMRRFRDLVRRLVEARDGPSMALPSPRSDHGTDAQPSPEEPSNIRPRWDRESRRLWFGETLCRAYRRRAKNQFELLEAFAQAGWVVSILNPFPGNEELLRQTIKDFNGQLEAGSPIRLGIDNTRAIWRIEGT
jgi:hypothetical protein